MPPFSPSRTFIVIPKRTSRHFSRFLPAKNSVAPDELQAHTGMFGAKTNDGYYELGLATSKIIRESLGLARGDVQVPEDAPVTPEGPPPPTTEGHTTSDFSNPWA